MTKQFTCSCFIRKNTPEIRQRLEELGYEPLDVWETDAVIYTETIGDMHTFSSTNIPSPRFDSLLSEDYKSCRDNEDLFFALAALNDTNAFKQWFICNIGNGKTIWHFSERPSMDEDSRFFGFISSKKATPEELLQHFNNIDK